ncbi:protoporphyrinogen/coproporphyrinogen oxidase [Methanofollis sp. UBA420]|uniref:protoporphyrinogen/coproporphyrinogen oxidase n=1 Tax=Methanofollis sp. UBA420 TaxID=1915514 RepID=UPI00316AEB78
MKTAILGGGLTGVTLARLLRERGEDVVVLEAEPEYGGLCRSKTIDGFTFDTGGSHIIFSRDAGALAFMKEALGQNRTERHRNTKIFYKGKYVKYPFENGLADLPKDDLFLCINEFVKTLIKAEKGELSAPRNFREWIVHTFGEGIADCYMVPYNRKIWKFPPEEMSTHWVDGRIPRPPVEDVIKAAVGIETEGYTHQAVFSYPEVGGIEALVRAIAAPVEDIIRTDFAVRSVREEDGAFVISDGTEEVRAERCISTIPLQALLPCLEGVPETVAEACRALKYNSVACICLGLKGGIPPYSWVYVPQEEIGLFNRISFPSGYSDGNAPDGCGSVLAEITYRDGDEAALMDDEALIDHTVEGLMKMGVVASRDQVVSASVDRQKFAYVIYDLAYQENVRTVRDYCKTRGIDLVGRFAEFEYINMDACIRHVIDFVKEYP